MIIVFVVFIDKLIDYPINCSSLNPMLIQADGEEWLNWTYAQAVLQASVAQLDAPSDLRPGGRGFIPHRGRQHSFVEIDHEIFSMFILSLPLIQEGQLSVSGKRMCIILLTA